MEGTGADAGWNKVTKGRKRSNKHVVNEEKASSVSPRVSARLSQKLGCKESAGKELI